MQNLNTKKGHDLKNISGRVMGLDNVDSDGKHIIQNLMKYLK